MCSTLIVVYPAIAGSGSPLLVSRTLGRTATVPAPLPPGELSPRLRLLEISTSLDWWSTARNPRKGLTVPEALGADSDTIVHKTGHLTWGGGSARAAPLVGLS